MNIGRTGKQNQACATYVRLVPLSERSGIDLDDSTLHKSVGSDKFVV